MKIQDFADMKHFEDIMSTWAMSTGLATVAVGIDGKYISDCYNFTDFCIKLTRGSTVGKARCEKCDRECTGIYHCHAGLMDFSIPLIVDGEKLGSVIGGQVLPNEPDEEQFRRVARELGINEERYISALRKVSIKPEQVIEASANLLGEVLNNFLNSEYHAKVTGALLNHLTSGVASTHELVEQIHVKTEALKSLQNKQKILALNASIEAARAHGGAGAGFSVVAKEVGKLSEMSAKVNKEIEDITVKIREVVDSMSKESS